MGENGEEIGMSSDSSSCAVHPPQQQQQQQQPQPPRSNPVQKTSQQDPHVNSGYTARQSSTVIYTSDRGPGN